MSDWSQDWPNSDDNVKNLYKRLKDLLHYNPETGIFTWLEFAYQMRNEEC